MNGLLLFSRARSSRILKLAGQPNGSPSYRWSLWEHLRLLSTSQARGGGETIWNKLFGEPKEGTVYPDGTRYHPNTPDIRIPYGYSSQTQPSLHPDYEWRYRENVPPSGGQRDLRWAMLVNALMWYWVLFHVWYQFDHLVGHFAYPDPSKWTDKELGIPPDSADDPEMVPVETRAAAIPHEQPMMRSLMFYFYADEEEDARPDAPEQPYQRPSLYYPIRSILLNRGAQDWASTSEYQAACDKRWAEENLLTGEAQKPSNVFMYRKRD